jgi:hypothetical protein
MIAYDVYLNGKRVCTAGGSDLMALTSAVTFFPNRLDKLGPLLTVGGALVDQKEYLHWAHQELRVGDRVEIRIVDTIRVDEVLRRDRPGHMSCPAEPGASPNGGPATRAGDSGAGEGPPSVS